MGRIVLHHFPGGIVCQGWIALPHPLKSLLRRFRTEQFLGQRAAHKPQPCQRRGHGAATLQLADGLQRLLPGLLLHQPQGLRQALLVRYRLCGTASQKQAQQNACPDNPLHAPQHISLPLARMQDALQMILRTFLWDVPMEGYLGDPWGATAPTALVAWREGKVRQVMLCLEQHELARRPCEWSAIRINHRLDPCPAQPCRGVGKPRATAGIVRRDPRWRRSMAGSPRALTRLTCRRPGPSWQPWPEP